jgi:ATPase subunit of ABC transporter with duplicated ATPase domains
VRVARVGLREFRNWERASVELSDGLTVISGPNGAGKTNLLEAVYFGCTARSPRTSSERELHVAQARVGRGLWGDREQPAMRIGVAGAQGLEPAFGFLAQGFEG